jgi:DNA-binding MarR family transcriptional regulator
MDDLGLVERRRAQSDARRVLVALTPRSRALVRRLAPLVEHEYLALEAAIGTALVQETYGLLDRLSAQLRRAANPAPEGAREPGAPGPGRGRRAPGG